MAFLLLASNPGVWGQTCFVESSNKKLTFPLIQQAPPARANEDQYPYYPQSGVASMKLERVNEAAGTPNLLTYYWQWSNHGPRRVMKGNLSPGVTDFQHIVVNFSTAERADACTLAQTATALNQDKQAAKFAADAKLTTTTQTPGPGTTTDVCILSRVPLKPEVTGIVLDYEVADGRTPRQTADFLTAWARLVHGAGRRSILYPNPLNAPTQRLTSITADNIKSLASEFDYVSLMLWSGNKEQDIGASYRDQLQMLGSETPHNKVLLTFELNKTSVKDAGLSRKFILDDHLGGGILWRNYAKQGGSCDTDVNRKIACFAFGECAQP